MLGPETCKDAGERPHSVSLGPIDAERYKDLIDNVLLRINRHPVQANLIVDMGTGAATGAAHQGDGFPSADFFTALF